MVIYTRRGDAGTSILCDGNVVAKDDARVHALGDIDELNSFLGLIKFYTRHRLIDKIQEKLFEIGAELGDYQLVGLIKQRDWQDLEKIIDKEAKVIGKITHFVYSGKTTNSALFDVARAICRRAERSYVEHKRKGKHNSETLRYLNRLSTLLFVLARVETKKAKKKEEFWVLKR